MTISSTSKDNPKGGKKVSKQSSTMSTSLKTIMRYGGNAKVGVTDDGKKSASNKDSKGTNAVSRDGKKSKVIGTAADVEMEENTNTDIDMRLYEDVEETTKGSGGKEMDKRGDNNSAGISYEEVMDINSPMDVIVQRWELEVEKWEKEVTGAATAEFKALAEQKLNNAQLMLKESLLRMTMAEDLRHDDIDNDAIIMEMEEDGKEAEDVGLIAANTSGDKDRNANEKLSGNEEAKTPIMNNNEGGRKLNQNWKEASASNKGKSRVTAIENWGDVSDDETVIQNNQEEHWQTVQDKKQNKKKKSETSNNVKNNNHVEQTKQSVIGKVNNPYTNVQLDRVNNSNKISATLTEATNRSSLTSYLEITKDSKRTKNKNSIRVNMSFTPRTSGYSELVRVAKELLSFGAEVDGDILLIPWDERCGNGPITLNDLMNPKNIGENIKRYFDKPHYVNLQPGSPVYGIGVHFSTNVPKYEFMTRWNLNKQEYKRKNRAAYSISLAPMQESPTAFIIGIAVGSTEKQDYELLNKKLSEDTGIEGLEVSFQNINQAGVTQEFWKLANERASAINADQYSRDHLREKYRWAPNSLAVYVPTRDMIAKARKALIGKYGKSIEGKDPIWPDGSSMRFLPIKGATIKNDKTKSIVRKRMAYHIWLKANEVIIDTNFTNIYDTIEAFEGLTFSEIVLRFTDDTNNRVFSHINRAWSNDPSKERWALSVKAHMYDEALRHYNNLYDHLYEVYGPAIKRFFQDNSTGWVDAVKTPVQTIQDDEDDWFEDDDDIDEAIAKGVIDSTFLRFFTTKDDEGDKSSVASWGTGNTTYTEIIAGKEHSSTGTSEITQESNNVSSEEVEKRRDIVRVRLRMRSVPDAEINRIMDKQNPYELAFSGVTLPSWDAEKEVLMIMAIRNQFTPNNQQNDESTKKY